MKIKIKNIEIRTFGLVLHLESGRQILKLEPGLVLSLFLLLYSCFCPAQTPEIDSLKKVLLTAKEDTNKVNALNDLAWELYNNNPDSTLILAQQAMVLAGKINFLKGKASAYGIAGVGNHVKGDSLNMEKSNFIS